MGQMARRNGENGLKVNISKTEVTVSSIPSKTTPQT